MSFRIVVVDDTEATRYVQSTWLRRAGFDVVEVATGTEALAAVDARADVVVLDVHLPDMTGFEVCSRLRARPETATVPVVHVTATAIDPRSRIQGLDRGADAYLTEPVDRDEFLATVRSLARTRATRRSADRLSRRLTRLAEATLPVNAADSLARLLEAAVQGAAGIFGSAAIAVAETEAGLAVRALAVGEGTEPVSQTFGGPLAQDWTGGPVYMSAPDLVPAWQALLDRAGVSAPRWFMWPVRGADGAIVVGMAVAVEPPSVEGDGGAALPEAEELILGQLVQAVAVALGNLRAYSHEHRTALTLQNALLPERLPDVPGLDLAARYNASGEMLSVGGDFYDVFELPSGDVVVVVGDVQGHSLQAAIRMAELRFSLRAFMIEHDRPERVVELLNRLLLTYYPEITATLVLLVVDRSLDRMQLVNAGHLPPLLLERPGDGGAAPAARYVEDSGTLLGVPGPPPRAVTVPFPPGASLVLVTDGLVERRDRSLTEGLALLLDVAATSDARSAAELADLLVDRFDVGTADDDVAVVVVRRDPLSGTPPAPPR